MARKWDGKDKGRTWKDALQRSEVHRIRRLKVNVSQVWQELEHGKNVVYSRIFIRWRVDELSPEAPVRLALQPVLVLPKAHQHHCQLRQPGEADVAPEKEDGSAVNALRDEAARAEGAATLASAVVGGGRGELVEHFVEEF